MLFLPRFYMLTKVFVLEYVMHLPVLVFHYLLAIRDRSLGWLLWTALTMHLLELLMRKLINNQKVNPDDFEMVQTNDNRAGCRPYGTFCKKVAT